MIVTRPPKKIRLGFSQAAPANKWHQCQNIPQRQNRLPGLWKSLLYSACLNFSQGDQNLTAMPWLTIVKLLLLTPCMQVSL